MTDTADSQATAGLVTAARAGDHAAFAGLAAAGARLREIRISYLADGVFYPQAVLSSGAVVDARPSDALNLAAISDVPVYAAAELLDLHTRNSSSDSPHERTVITAVRYDPPPQPEHE